MVRAARIEGVQIANRGCLTRRDPKRVAPQQSNAPQQSKRSRRIRRGQPQHSCGAAIQGRDSGRGVERVAARFRTEAEQDNHRDAADADAPRHRLIERQAAVTEVADEERGERTEERAHVIGEARADGPRRGGEAHVQMRRDLRRSVARPEDAHQERARQHQRRTRREDDKSESAPRRPPWRWSCGAAAADGCFRQLPPRQIARHGAKVEGDQIRQRAVPRESHQRHMYENVIE